MAKNNKTHKSSSKNVKIALGVTIGVIAVCVIGWFIYISGIIPQLLPGMTVYETAPDGVTLQKVESVSVLETNYHFSEVFQQYSQYGYVTRDTLDEVYDPATGETYRDMILQQVGMQVMNQILINRAAEQDGFLQYSQAALIADKQSQNIEMMASLYGYQSVDQYLFQVYGTGMTLRVYKDILAKEILTSEYQEYIGQFKFMPTQEEIQAAFDADPTAYQLADFNYFFIPADVDSEGNVTGMEEAEAAASKIVVAAPDSPEAFRDAVIAYLTEKGDEGALASFEDDGDPTRCEGYTAQYTDYFVEGFTDFVFSPDTQEGDIAMIPTETGYYVVRFDKVYLDDAATVSYRVMTLPFNTTLDLETTDFATLQAEAEAQAAQIISGHVDSMTFYSICKANSSDSNEMISGGFVPGAKITAFQSNSTVEGATPLAADITQAGEWLFDPARVQGDYIVILSQDKTRVLVYYFECNEPSWQYQVKNQLIVSAINDWATQLQANNPSYEVNKGWMEQFTY